MDNTPNKSSETTIEARNYDLPLSEDTRKQVRSLVEAKMREIYDPEIPVDIFELGLIYEISVAEDAKVDIVMTLTTPNCPVAESMPGDVQLRAEEVEGVRGVKVDLVWDPPWTIYMMSEAARLEMGLM